ncbi:MAG: putative molybdenum carrier protein [Myxococcota bacterium]
MSEDRLPRPRIVSGAQTGADRAALDVGLELGLDVGGWVPRGRLAEDGIIPARYPNLREAESADPAQRTELNVRDSDATLILSHGALSGGTALTRHLAEAQGKALLEVDLAALGRKEASRTLARWLGAERPATLNVAGPRASKDPKIYAAAVEVLRAALD